jgi:hypothetical protein
MFLAGGPQNPLEVPIVKQLKLVDLTNVTTEVLFVCPESSQCVLLFGYPSGVSGKPPVGGRLTVSNEDSRAEMTLTPDKVTECNWLQRFSLAGFLVADPNSGSWNWGSTLRYGSTNLLTISGVPTNGGSVWLSYTRPSGWDMPYIRRWLKHS